MKNKALLDIKQNYLKVKFKHSKNKVSQLNFITKINSIQLIRVFLFLEVILIGLSDNSLNAQSKKSIKKYQIKEMTEMELDMKKQPAQHIKENTYKYNTEGLLIEKIDYRKDGTIKNRIVNLYDKYGNLTEELEYEGINKLIVKKLNSYNADGDKLSEKEYDQSDRLIKKTIFKYDSMGFKIEKQVLDEHGNQLSSKKYIYKK